MRPGNAKEFDSMEVSGISQYSGNEPVLRLACHATPFAVLAPSWLWLLGLIVRPSQVGKDSGHEQGDANESGPALVVGSIPHYLALL